ncbi:MAG: hypothetical protein K6D02_05285 [Lachnospiraceae bacterium]|nr:hypothetical protein [Lachnospiraceae bacterium]
MHFSMSKDDYNYTLNRKKNNIILIILMIILGVSIFLVGYFVNGRSTKNVFTVVAILFALPGAKFMTSLIILLPSKKNEKEEYERIKGECKEPSKLYSSVVVTSVDKVMYMKYIYIGHANVFYVYDEKKKYDDEGKKGVKKRDEDRKYVKDYIYKGVNNYSSGFKVQMFTEVKKFENEIKRVEEKDEVKNEAEVISYIESLIV